MPNSHIKLTNEKQSKIDIGNFIRASQNSTSQPVDDLIQILGFEEADLPFGNLDEILNQLQKSGLKKSKKGPKHKVVISPQEGIEEEESFGDEDDDPYQMGRCSESHVSKASMFPKKGAEI